jgi:hypothetical protein
MPIQFDKFDQNKVDSLKNHLKMMAEKEKAKFYEIYVDNLKAVPKTDEPAEFDSFEDYLTADSEQVKIVIYNSSSSPRNDQYVFLLKARNRDEATTLGLSGLPGKVFTKSSANDWRDSVNKKNAEQLEIQSLKKEISELNEEIEEKEEQINQLATLVETAKANNNKLGGVHLGDIMSVALEGLVRRNTHLLSQIPAVSGLAGIIEKDNERIGSQLPQVDSHASFKRKEDTSTPMNSQQKEFLALFDELQKHFADVEMGQVMEILDILSQDKTTLQPVQEFLQTETE